MGSPPPRVANLLKGALGLCMGGFWHVPCPGHAHAGGLLASHLPLWLAWGVAAVHQMMGPQSVHEGADTITEGHRITVAGTTAGVMVCELCKGRRAFNWGRRGPRLSASVHKTSNTGHR